MNSAVERSLNFLRVRPKGTCRWGHSCGLRMRVLWSIGHCDLPALLPERTMSSKGIDAGLELARDINERALALVSSYSN